MTRMTLCVFAAAAALSVSAAPASAMSSQQAARELKELRSSKRGLTMTLDHLSVLARNQHLTSWQNHAGVLDEARIYINRSGERLARLEANLDKLTPAQRAAVDGYRLELARIATEVQALMNSLQENRLVTVRPDYFERTQALAARAIEARRNTDQLVETALNGSSVRQQTGD